MFRSSRRARGFTIVEILVVISAIAVLAGLLLPAISQARRRAKKTEEINRIRQVGVGWNLYANANNDAALPGFLAPEVQEFWRVRYQFPNKRAVSREASGPWTWRLMPYLTFDHETVHGHLGEADGSVLAMVEEADEIAFEPGFGYNGLYVGGWWEGIEQVQVGGGNTKDVAFPRFRSATDLQTGQAVSVVVTSPSSIHDTSRFVVFCSSSELAPGQYKTRVIDSTPGSHLVEPPFVAEEAKWSSERLTQILVAERASVPIARYTGQAAVLYGDLHTSPESPNALDDQRFWINAADRKNWQHAE